MTNTIDSSLLLSDYQQKQRKTGSDILGKDDFLKILMVQLQNQDPTNPMQDKDFIAQMATFSTLEQITNMGKTMENFVKVQEQSQVIAYNQFVGKDVTWHKISTSASGQEPVIEEGTGRVASVQFKDNSVIFILDDGTKLEPANISQINETSKENAMVQASMMIGKIVTFLDENKVEKTEEVKSVSFKDGKTVFQLADGTTITSSQITKIE
ncbi:flagellar basal-body rod modification protein FlgD [Cytobacillus eiseniae]|uniref:Basal-body rod modification protein FlgD n=1 Tax=Cytobacillus eiseniae TaxID=762947 RepID=A0ABS4RCJ5_9BACI|nr:flagellar hook assembly protein FlgD [Cytobacillus eiseniae]MBP2240131.1 flagellar basal-body rod modification protein FlgD [Cytobacillus eiseniae]